MTSMSFIPKRHKVFNSAQLIQLILSASISSKHLWVSTGIVFSYLWELARVYSEQVKLQNSSIKWQDRFEPASSRNVMQCWNQKPEFIYWFHAEIMGGKLRIYQYLGPLPNARKVPGSRFDFSSSLNRSGSNVSGFG